ncbi:hypothetical protein [Parabacteroides pacaensis]|uniref:hypothetical protein n=1 Tax=Parabacteroides pacaensis TaxID=2086575 RepID=UPI00131AB503|nr:hypothetical protein [Parabacteroides pacaensis]
MRRSLIFYIQIAFIGFFFFNCQEKQVTKSLDYELSVKEMKEDIDHYFKQMEEIHPCRFICSYSKKETNAFCAFLLKIYGNMLFSFKLLQN